MHAVHVLEDVAAQRAQQHQLLRVVEEAHPIAAGVVRVAEVDVVGDFAEQALVVAVRIVFQVLGQVGGAFAAVGAGVHVVVGRRHLPMVGLAALRQVADEGQLRGLGFVRLGPVMTARGKCLGH